MDIKESGSVVLTAYHSYTPSRLPIMDQSCVPRFGRMSSSASRDVQCWQVFNRSISQESTENSSMEDFWSEVRNIKESSLNGQEEQNIVDVKTPDEGELEAEWLQEVGLSTLVSGTGAEDGMALLSTLTRAQAAAVQRRLDTYTQTTRKKSKQPVRDVRDIFGVTDPPVSMKSLPSPCVLNFATIYQALIGKDLLFFLLVNNQNDKMEGQQGNAEITEELNWDIPYSESLPASHREQRHRHSCTKRHGSTALPKFTICEDKLGLTRIGDLSHHDMKKIHNLTLIEITTFFDALGMELKKNRILRVKTRESGLFGVPLTTLLENDQKKVPGTKVPLIFQKLLLKLEHSGLETEGILRVPGSASRVKSLRQELEAKFHENFDWDQVRQNDAACLLKMFIRELPNSLLTMEYLPAFSAVQNLSQPKLQLQALHLLIMLLPDPNRDTIKAFLEFLCKVIANEAKNRMSLWNVSMIVAPNLFMCKGKSGNQQEAEAATNAANIVQQLIKYQDILWTIPSFMISQVRKMNESENSGNRKHLGLDKSMKKILRMINMEWERPERAELDIPEGVIRVYSTQLSKVSMAIQLDTETKASDILSRFQYENSFVNVIMFGFPAGERCLDLNTRMLDLYRINPHATWVIKPRTP
uniref:Rho GTPase activating protein 28 n=1 Tax=Callorhinchus milii TaxID=7868 RepID=A0A4W3JDR9_CALMI